MSTLNVHRSGARNNKPTAAQEYITRDWASVLRQEYRILRREGLSRLAARVALFSAYHVGLNAGREEAHAARLAEIRGAA